MKIDTNKITEAEIQFELSRKLMNSNYNVYLERNIELPELGNTKRHKKPISIRVDIAVCDSKDNLVCVIEVKNYKEPSLNDKCRQHLKYLALRDKHNTPFIYCWNESYINECYNWVNNLFYSTGNLKWG